MIQCVESLAQHAPLQRRRQRSASLLAEISAAFEASDVLAPLPVNIFCAGSLARQEIGSRSDLDVFVTVDDDDPALRSLLARYTLFGELINLNKRLGLPEFSNDGEYLKIQSLNDLKGFTGSRQDDSENIFTTRMLLILESEPLLHRDVYERHLADVVKHYYRDQVGKRSFRPLFLLNDLLRYWRTLCLNYEERRHDASRPWRKKNVNLKFSRMITVFSTVLPLVTQPTPTDAEVYDLCRRTALFRLATSIDRLADPALSGQWPDVLDMYEEFLMWKEDENIEHDLASRKAAVRRNAEAISTFLHKALTHDKIPAEYRRYLVL